MMVERKVGWSPTLLHLRGEPRRGARPEPAVVQGLPPSVARSVLPAVARQPRLVFPRLDEHQEAQWKQQYRIWMERRARVRHERRPRSRPATMPATSIRCTGSASRASSSCRRRPASIRSKSSSTRPGTAPAWSASTIGSARCARASSPICWSSTATRSTNLKLLNPYGTDVMLVNGRLVSNYTAPAAGDRVQVVHGGGIEWTIKDGIPYHVPTLMREVRDMVAQARETHPHDGALMAARHAPGRATASTSRSSSPRRRRSSCAPSSTPTRSAPGGSVDALGHDAARARVRTPSNGGRPSTATRSSGRLGGVFRGTVMQFEAGRGFFLADVYWLPPDGDPIGPMALEVTCAPRRGRHRACASCRTASKKACAGGATTRSSPSDGSARSRR